MEASHRGALVPRILALAAGTLLAASSPVLAMSASPASMTTVSGSITLSGVPARRAGAEVTLEKRDPGTGDFAGYASKSVGPDGVFTFVAEEGTYRLRAQADDRAGEWYGETYVADDATLVEVAGESVAIGAIDLERQVSVRGEVVGDDGTGLVCLDTSWYIRDRSGDYRFFADGPGGNNATRFLVVLPPATYKMRVEDSCSSGRTLGRWYHDSTTKAGSTPVTLSGTQTVVLEPMTLVEGPDIVGVLRYPDGSPARGERVRAISVDDPGFSPSSGAVSNNHGEFSLATGDGRFRLEIGGRRAPLQHYQSWSLADSPVIEVGRAENVTLGDVAVARGGTMSGSVRRQDGRPVDRAEVTAYGGDGNVMATAHTLSDGRFTLDSLVPGDYRIRVHDPGGAFPTEFYDDASTLDTADHVSVTDAKVTDIEAMVITDQPAALPNGTDVWGYATGPGGRPEPGVQVCAFAFESPLYMSGGCVDRTLTDVNGRYVLTDLDQAASGGTVTEYRIQFVDPRYDDGDRPRLRETWNAGSVSNYHEATSISVPADDLRIRSDVAVQALGGIRGTLTTEFGFTPRHAEVFAVGSTGQIDYHVQTDWDGTFRIDHMEPGSYRVFWTGYEDRPRARFNSLFPAGPTPPPMGVHITVPADGYVTVDGLLDYQFWCWPCPRIFGPPEVGATLSMSPGEWSGPPSTLAHTWLREGQPVGTGPTYVVQPRDAGRRITVRVEASQFWYRHHTASATAYPWLIEGEPLDEAEPVGASQTKVSASYQRHHRRPRVLLRVAVKAASGTPYGSVRVTERGRVVVAKVRLRDGRAVVVVKNPSERRHRYVVTYSGSATLAPSRTTVRVDTR